MRIRELDVFTIRMEREKLAKDAETVISIFATLETMELPLECVAINIDWFSITMRSELKRKMIDFMQHLARNIHGLNVNLEEDFRLLVVEDYEFNSRKIGMLMTALEMQDIEIRMVRQIKNNQKIVIGFQKNQYEEGKQIVLDIL